ncbi:MAG: tetratricopeptide repeat protein [Parcubacteria group bacterium]|nr:tetratricopeptide repeat protein [Parcubacteria group bacterium]
MSFFEQNGYLVRSQAVEKIADLFPFVNADIPLVLALRASPDAPAITTSLRVVIGYSTSRKMLMVHDNLFGNNYEWSFDDVEAMMRDKPRVALAVTPGIEIAKTIAGPNHGIPYPPRLGIMDDPGMQEIQVKWTIISALELLYAEKRISTAGAITKLWEEIIANPSFGKLHPAAQMLASFNLARMYTNNLREHQKAIDVLKTVTIPLLSIDFSKPFGEWERNNPGVYDDPHWQSTPRVLLGVAYSRLGNKVEAEKAYRAALSYNPNDDEAQRLLKELPAS